MGDDNITRIIVIAIDPETEQIYLTRRNLLALLSKLDRTKEGDTSTCTIIKYDNKHPKYPQTMDAISVTAVEDEDYYTDRSPGAMFPADEKRIYGIGNERSNEASDQPRSGEVAGGSPEGS